MKRLIDRRVDGMMAAGLLEEVRALAEAGVPRRSTAMQAIGFCHVVYLSVICSGAEAGACPPGAIVSPGR